MKFVIQRVRKSTVSVQEKEIAAIGKGLLVLVGIQRGDTKAEMDWMINKLLKMRIFEDENRKMNDSVSAIDGALLLVPNFTLYADAVHGNRPGFKAAEDPLRAKKIYNQLVSQIEVESNISVENGEFGANMQVALINDGPVTIILEKEAVQ